MRVLYRYLSRQIYGATALVLLAFLGLFAFFDLVHEMGDLGNGGYQIQHALIYVSLSLPSRAYELFPIAVLIGTLYALTTLARHSEITVMRASGLSTRGFLKVLGRTGLAFVIITLILGELIAPRAERAAEEWRLKAMSSVIGQQFRSGLWLKDESYFINVREVLPDTSLRGVRIYEFDNRSALRSISEAEAGEFVRPDRWHLKNVVQTVFSTDLATIRRLPEMEWKSSVNPDILNVLLVSPEHMSMPNLVLYIRHLAENRQNTDRYIIALWKKLIYPLASLVMMALALPFSFLQNRMEGVSVRVFAGIMLGILFQMLNGLFSSLGVINSWPPLLAAVTPSILFLFMALAMLWRAEAR
ncbi:MAG: LPS export ABC transporter permease LptG [Rhodocyclaceae bacterium]|nr:LPS export ABC transporter permease LptG [Rhodocyclaceae bacterium]